MRAWCIEEDKLVERVLPSPVLKTNCVRIATEAFGINRADLLQLQGLYPAPKGIRNDILGLETVGRVVEVCSSVPEVERTRWLGKRVMALLPGEGYASEVVVDIGCIMPIPSGVSTVHAAAIPEAFLTAYDALWCQSGIESNSRVLIHAIGSGVGDAAKQLCIANNIEVFGTSRSATKCEVLSTPHVPVFQIQEGVFPKDLPKADIVLDFVGAAYFEQNLKQLNVNGHLQVVGLLGGVKAQINLGLLLAKRLSIRGTTLRSRSLFEKTKLIQDFVRDVLPLFDNGDVHPNIDSIFCWEDVHQAHDKMRNNLNVGKLIVTTPTG